ncbi:hypothetical protein CQW23_35034 [Capsicum baccatum]|uniref:Protein TAR1 n=1 Tax=Capsicum baccatum TaxID=33114 RepID=A0A2G2UX72_CAPBA|nr:hypothetical protein CQW23_35034 [Capsicum baccatum]
MLMHGRCPRRLPTLAADWARPHACSAWSLPQEQHPVLAARMKAPPRPTSSASSPVVDDATDNRHERTMKRRRRCYTGTDGSHGLAMHAAMRPRSSPTWPLSAYANCRHRIPLVRTSSELAVRRAGKTPEGTVPSPSPGQHAATRSLCGSSSSSPPTADGFRTGTPVPSPQSQSFSQTYGSILPTSLAYIISSTRGCSPWRPNAVMSTTGCGWQSVLRIFKGRWVRAGHQATCGALPAAGPYLRLSRFQGVQAVKQKR